MQQMQAYKFEIMPIGEQERNMRRYAGACRFVFNKALAWQIEAYDKDNTVNFSYAKLANLLPVWKKEFVWLCESPSQTLQQVLKDLERGYKNFFAKRAKFPKFKKRGKSDSFRFPQGCELDEANARIRLPKLGWMRYRKSRDILGEVKNVTLSKVRDKWFMSVQTEREVKDPIPKATSSIGIDMGIKRFATMSDGTFIKPLSSFKKHEERLRRYQRRMSRKVKGSSNWKKAKAKVAKIHADIANSRKDFLHKATTAIANAHSLVCIEDLKIKNMSKSAKGTHAKNGTNVAAKRGLNKAILDQGWGEFRRQLEYKLKWRGGWLVAVDPKYTSRTCPACFHESKDNRTTQAKFKCVDCGYDNNADVVGALNVLARGHRGLACGEDVRRAKVIKPKRAASMKQEPTRSDYAGSNPCIAQ
jgi:putative transposase